MFQDKKLSPPSVFENEKQAQRDTGMRNGFFPFFFFFSKLSENDGIFITHANNISIHKPQTHTHRHITYAFDLRNEILKYSLIPQFEKKKE